MAFHTSKCKIMIFNGGPKHARFTLGSSELKVVQTHKYLGVLLSSRYVTNIFKDHFQSFLEKVKSRVANIRNFGFSMNGFTVKTTIKLYKLLVRPILEFCAQSLSYARYSQPYILGKTPGFANKLEHTQTQLLKTLINCPRSTSPAIVRLFCGIEPIACRLEILKLRYYWRLLHSPPDTITHKILHYRKANFLAFNNGFARDAFNICTKYNAIHLWHGRATGDVNPLNSIRRIIISQNLRKDLEIGRTRKCSFATIFLANVFLYQKTYQIVEPFCQAKGFASPDGRKRFLKALLHPCSYLDDCPLCGHKQMDICDHLITSCSRVLNRRKKLILKLKLYNYPAETLPLNKTNILLKALDNRLWRKCFTEFLSGIDY